MVPRQSHERHRSNAGNSPQRAGLHAILRAMLEGSVVEGPEYVCYTSVRYQRYGEDVKV